MHDNSKYSIAFVSHMQNSVYLFTAYKISLMTNSSLQNLMSRYLTLGTREALKAITWFPR